MADPEECEDLDEDSYAVTVFNERRIYIAWGDPATYMTSFAHEWGHVECENKQIRTHHLRGKAHQVIEAMALAIGPNLLPPRPSPERR